MEESINEMVKVIQSTRLANGRVELSLPNNTFSHEKEDKQSVRKEFPEGEGRISPESGINEYPNVRSENHLSLAQQENQRLKGELALASEELKSLRDHMASQLQEERIKARAEGIEAGRKEGLKQGKKQIENEVKQLQDMLVTLAALKAKVIETSEDRIIEIIITAVCKIIGEQLLGEGAIKTILQSAIHHVMGTHIEKIHVSPFDYKRLMSFDNRLEGDFQGITFIEDASINIGGCILETNAGTVERCVEQQLNQLKELLLQARKGSEVSDLVNIEAGQIT